MMTLRGEDSIVTAHQRRTDTLYRWTSVFGRTLAHRLSTLCRHFSRSVDNYANQSFLRKHRWRAWGLCIVCFLYLGLSIIMASSNLDIDEFNFIRDPYELLGGDYTTGYLREHNYGAAFKTLIKSYYFYWKYRALFSPIISENDKELFHSEETHFGYI